MFLNELARQTPQKPAYIMAGSGKTVSYRDLNSRTLRGASLLRLLGLSVGDRVVLYCENNSAFLEIALACIRCGLYCVLAGRHLKEQELLHILADSGAKALIASARCLEALPRHALPENLKYTYLIEGATEPFRSWAREIERHSDEEHPNRGFGLPLFYSSGTTGEPKGVLIPLNEANDAFWRGPFLPQLPAKMGLTNDASNRNLVTGPLYHVAPFWFACIALLLGGTAVIMEKFDAEWALMLIQQYRISHVHMVPTMFVRLLMLDPCVRSAYDLSTLRQVEHNSAPCPISVKEQLIGWLGPIVFEVYGASEPAGSTFINSRDWLQHKGSVGRAIDGAVHILDEDRRELPARQIGEIFFSDSLSEFDYLNAPEKKRSRLTDRGWFSYGDLGYMDEEGYLYLVDRKNNTIIVGGEKVYPLEVENHLMSHSAVADVAIVGVDDPIYGQRVQAYVQLRTGKNASDELARELIDYCRARLADIKCPASVRFVESLPRSEHGKLLKRYLTA